MSNSVKIEGFSYCYPDGTLALRNINLAVEEGQKVALIGPNGAGKSTLLQAMAGFIRGSGTIHIDGLKLCSQNLRQIRSVMSCYMGNPEEHLSMPTVYEDIIYGPLSLNLDVQAVRQNVDLILGRMGLTALIKKASRNLSDGQKRSAAIASILSVSPKIILLDGPYSGLDLRSYNNLIGYFEELTQTMIFSTCSLDFAARAADRVIFLYNGQVIADGAASEILHDEKLLVAHGLDR
jgi:cobalt/nickel transport system ATP-binding protein